jgi:hypothetical protein
MRYNQFCEFSLISFYANTGFLCDFSAFARFFREKIQKNIKRIGIFSENRKVYLSYRRTGKENRK